MARLLESESGFVEKTSHLLASQIWVADQFVNGRMPGLLAASPRSILLLTHQHPRVILHPCIVLHVCRHVYVARGGYLDHARSANAS